MSGSLGELLSLEAHSISPILTNTYLPALPRPPLMALSPSSLTTTRLPERCLHSPPVSLLNLLWAGLQEASLAKVTLLVLTQRTFTAWASGLLKSLNADDDISGPCF